MKNDALLENNFISGRKWLKLPEYERDVSKPIEEQYRELEDHHQKEVEVLLSEMRGIYSDFSSAFHFLKRLEGSLIQENKYQGTMTQKFLESFALRWGWNPNETPMIERKNVDI